MGKSGISCKWKYSPGCPQTPSCPGHCPSIHSKRGSDCHRWNRHGCPQADILLQTILPNFFLHIIHQSFHGSSYHPTGFSFLNGPQQKFITPIGGQPVIKASCLLENSQWAKNFPFRPMLIQEKLHKRNILFGAFWQIAAVADDFLHSSPCLTK